MAEIFVGRRRELAELTRLHAAATDGHGSVALIGGDPGLGQLAPGAVVPRQHALEPDLHDAAEVGISESGQEEPPPGVDAIAVNPQTLQLLPRRRLPTQILRRAPAPLSPGVRTGSRGVRAR
ncbi:hypothetical protein [Planobispora longispora]|uniref:hypothetical protein n=1 Tax=Planobispora longispora TaxID=28887 RepID=UPI0019452B37|nr:hypothetical protein [Planobispora longispora]